MQKSSNNDSWRPMCYVLSRTYTFTAVVSVRKGNFCTTGSPRCVVLNHTTYLLHELHDIPIYLIPHCLQSKWYHEHSHGIIYQVSHIYLNCPNTMRKTHPFERQKKTKWKKTVPVPSTRYSAWPLLRDHTVVRRGGRVPYIPTPLHKFGPSQNF